MALRGLDLPVTALENIYWKNFERIAGKTPKPVAMDRRRLCQPDGRTVPWNRRALLRPRIPADRSHERAPGGTGGNLNGFYDLAVIEEDGFQYGEA